MWCITSSGREGGSVLNQQQPTECVFTGVCSCVLTDFVLCLCEAPCSAAAPPTGEAHPPTRDQYNTLHQYHYSNYSVYISITVCHTGVPSVRQSCTRTHASTHTDRHTNTQREGTWADLICVYWPGGGNQQDGFSLCPQTSSSVRTMKRQQCRFWHQQDDL